MIVRIYCWCLSSIKCWKIFVCDSQFSNKIFTWLLNILVLRKNFFLDFCLLQTTNCLLSLSLWFLFILIIISHRNLLLSHIHILFLTFIISPSLFISICIPPFDTHLLIFTLLCMIIWTHILIFHFGRIHWLRTLFSLSIFPLLFLHVFPNWCIFVLIISISSTLLFSLWMLFWYLC